MVEQGDVPVIHKYRKTLRRFYVFSLIMICLQGALWLAFDASR
jgi:hypothetical protein